MKQIEIILTAILAFWGIKGGLGGVATPTSIPLPAPSREIIKAVGGIFGKATYGPVCPGPTRGGDKGKCADKPYSGEFGIKSSLGVEVAKFKTGADGSYSVDLKPGKYTVEKTSPGWPFGGQNEVTVGEKRIELNINLDSGIR